MADEGVKGKVIKVCDECHGKGWKTYIYYVKGKKVVEEDRCWKCEGLGKIIEK